MDKPLVLTTRLEATEVDKEAHNVDVAARYPLDFYRAAAERRPAKEVEPMIDESAGRLGTDRRPGRLRIHARHPTDRRRTRSGRPTAMPAR